jgi:hypothetical protein
MCTLVRKWIKQSWKVSSVRWLLAHSILLRQDQDFTRYAFYWKSDLCISRNETAQPRKKFPIPTHMYLWVIYIFPESFTDTWMWNWETEHYDSVLEITERAVSFLEIHKSEPDIYIVFSPALHLQCAIIEQWRLCLERFRKIQPVFKVFRTFLQ